MKPQKEPLVQRNFGLRYSTDKLFTELAERTRLSKSTLFREAIDDILKKYSRL